MIERGVILAPQGGWIELEHLFTHVSEAKSWESAISASGNLEQGKAHKSSSSLLDSIISNGLSLEQLEGELLTEAVKRADGNLAGAARILGITRPQLQYRLKRNMP